MADEDKTEEPTAKKRTESYSSGQFAKAPEINTAMVLFATVIILAVLTPGKSKEIMLFTESILGHLHEIEVTPEGVVGTLLSMGKFVVSFVFAPSYCFLPDELYRRGASDQISPDT